MAGWRNKAEELELEEEEWLEGSGAVQLLPLSQLCEGHGLDWMPSCCSPPLHSTHTHTHTYTYTHRHTQAHKRICSHGSSRRRRKRADWRGSADDFCQKKEREREREREKGKKAFFLCVSLSGGSLVVLCSYSLKGPSAFLRPSDSSLTRWRNEQQRKRKRKRGLSFSLSLSLSLSLSASLQTRYTFARPTSEERHQRPNRLRNANQRESSEAAAAAEAMCKCMYSTL